MKLEQTINRSSRGIIGHTKALEYVTEWQLIYHEVLDISNFMRSLTKSNNIQGDTALHPQLSKSQNSSQDHVLPLQQEHCGKAPA